MRLKGIGRLKHYTRIAIATHHRSPVVKILRGFASFVESAYANEGSNFYFSGEQTLIKKLRAARFLVVFDVGANFGDWSLAALAAWPHCQVHAFEVVPSICGRLSRIACDSKFMSRITVNCFGLADENGDRQMYYFPDHPEMSGPAARFDNFVTIPFQAQLSTGDRYCDDRGIDTVDFLKIDVEGSEPAVLQGFEKRLAMQKIHCLQFEYGRFAAENRFLLADFYKRLGYLYWIGKIYPNCVDFRDYHFNMEDFRFSNYCCVSKQRPDLREALA
jgi:FkbM family methyltransferase